MGINKLSDNITPSMRYMLKTNNTKEKVENGNVIEVKNNAQSFVPSSTGTRVCSRISRQR